MTSWLTNRRGVYRCPFELTNESSQKINREKRDFNSTSTFDLDVSRVMKFTLVSFARLWRVSCYFAVVVCTFNGTTVSLIEATLFIVRTRIHSDKMAKFLAQRLCSAALRCQAQGRLGVRESRVFGAVSQRTADFHNSPRLLQETSANTIPQKGTPLFLSTSIRTRQQVSGFGTAAPVSCLTVVSSVTL